MRRDPSAALHRFTRLAGLGAILCMSSHALARHRIRPRFEPSDLDLDEPGSLGIDEQVGAIRSQGPWRLVMSDFEVTLGVLKNVELSIDSAYAVEGPDRGPYRFDHAAPDITWASARIGLIDSVDDDDASTWAFGVRFGPKLPTIRGARGVGAEGLMLLERSVGRTTLTLNAGGLVDPAPAAGEERPRGGEASIGVSEDVDAQGRFALGAELSGVRFASADHDQLLVSGSFTFTPRRGFELSVTNLVGLLSGSDRYGLLFGASFSVPLARAAKASSTDP